MKVLVSINYAENKNLDVLSPLVASHQVERLYVVHDLPVPELPKAERYGTPGWLRSPGHRLTLRGVIRSLSHFTLMLYVTLSRRPDAIIGFNVFPHSLYAFICGGISRKPAIAYIDDWPGIWEGRRKLLPMLRRCYRVGISGGKGRDYLVAHGVAASKTFVLPNAIDIQRFRPVNLPRRYDLLFVGRLAPAKNLDTLMGAIHEVAAFRKDLKVAIVGEGHLRGSLEQLVTQLDITTNVEFLGHMGNPDYYYNSSRIFILTSRYEGLPMAMLEAMACGLPCIVPDVGNLTDAALDGVNALVVKDAYDVKGFAKAILTLLNDEQLYHRLSSNTRRLVEENYSYKKATEMWNQILAQNTMRG